MKKFSLIIIICVAATYSLNAQKIAFIESTYIFERVTTYKAAQEKLNLQSEAWQKEIETKMKEVEDLYKKFQAEQALYTDQIKQQKIGEIDKKEKELALLQKQRFGPEGDVFKKRQELIQPIINQMYDEVRKIAEAKGYGLVLDKSNGNSLVFTKPSLNISEQVIKAMGY